MSEEEGEPIAAKPDTIMPCPTCGQRVLMERDGSYRQIAELRHNSEMEYRQRYQRFVWKVQVETYLSPKRDWRDVVRALHKEADRVIGHRWLLLDEET